MEGVGVALRRRVLSQAIGRIDRDKVALADLIFALKRAGHLDIFTELVRAKALERLAHSRGVIPSRAQVQEAVDAYRAEQNILTAGDTYRWLAARRMTVEDLERMVESSLIEQNVTRAVATPEATEAFFSQHQGEFDRAEVSIIVTADRAAATEALRRVAEPAASFRAVARERSNEASSRARGGYLGIVYQEDLPPAVASAVFSTDHTPGTLLGPIEDEEGVYIVLVHERITGKLDEPVRHAIARALVQNELDRLVTEARAEFYVLP